MTLMLLLILAVAVRVIPILGNAFPFMYDNAKDSLVMLEMFTQHKPALVGPTTSIDGLFYGPFWYYIALPFNILLKFHPFASVAMVIFIALISIVLLYRYVHPFAAFVYALSVGAIGSQQAAWTPYMTSLAMLPIILLLRQVESKKIIRTHVLVLLAFFSSLLFHFEVAFGIIFLPLLLITLLTMQIRVKPKQLVFAALVFLSTLIPSALFELRHQFIQTKSVINFVTHYRENAGLISPNSTGPDRITEVLRYLFDSAHLSILPNPSLTFALPAIFLIVVYLSRKEGVKDRRFAIPIIVGAFLLYLEMPIKPYYFAAFTPLWIYLFAQAVHHLLPKYKVHIVIFFLIFAGAQLAYAKQNYQKLARTSTILLAPKLQAVEQAYAFSEGKPFASYQYVPEIYDYTYQHIYLTEGLTGKPLPTEFSYAPGEIAYIPQKHLVPSQEKPEFIMLIVEKYKQKRFFDPWYDRVAANLEILDQKQVNDEITVYKTKPKSSP